MRMMEDLFFKGSGGELDCLITGKLARHAR